MFAAEVLGWALKLSGSSPEAMAFTEESFSLGTLDAALLLHAATIFEANGDASRAAELREKVSVVEPWYRALHPELTHWLRSTGRPAGGGGSARNEPSRRGMVELS